MGKKLCEESFEELSGKHWVLSPKIWAGGKSGHLSRSAGQKEQWVIPIGYIEKYI